MAGTVPIGATLAVVLVALTLVAAGAARLGGLPVWGAVLRANTRAVLQLTVVSLVIVGVLRSWWLTAAFGLLMYGVAAFTSGRRIGAGAGLNAALLAIGAGVAPVLAVLLSTGLVPLKPVAVVPIVGILVGGAMTATSLSGRRALDELATRHGEYEAALALGFTERDAALEVCRPPAAQGLVPALDQTRTVGLVTLPGAFVGALLGGAGPVQAGAIQLLVLVALLAVETTAVLVVVELVARRILRRDPAGG
ncbi:ABC transporter permease [Virgisporangium aliadipatigenens]|uniref:ABC transporter permease n=1 Tax=Virgisporangium aliadipatigenens TaxID=741659 RepID=A0A8J4DNX7_9ACTN|nr:ABC transporter permease [Virgisporangium aliadipatigenens]GIJ44276.1 ABC transporter permease [Virgisporangium aliadipatigenens]